MHFTCNTCGLAFQDAENQREHMKGEWHRYNLKRRVADLPSVDEQTFNAKVSVLNPKESTDTTKIRGRKGGKSEEDVQKTVRKKEIRRKEKEAVLLEKKMALLEIARKRMTESQQPDGESEKKEESDAQEDVSLEKDSTIEENSNNTAEENDLTEEQLYEEKVKNRVDIKPEECLFCGKLFADQKEAIAHMFHSHGLFIPERDYLVDEAGLIHYLAEKIGFGNICLCCNFQGRSLESVRNHMLAKRHCRLPYETEDEQLEISEFYDFTSSYKPREKIVVVDSGENGIDGDDWEDVEGEENSDEEEAPREVSYVVGSDLVLPTGLIVGHRSLQRYYKQNLPVERVLKEGEGTVIAADARHLSVTYDKKLAQEQKRVWTKQQKDAYRDDRRSAKFINNQPHFRDELLQ